MSRQPNILFIMTDQQRYDALGIHGSQAITPHLDALAHRSADLSSFFTQSPVCVPSRCNLFTGRYPHSHRVRQNHSRLGHDETHLFKVLKQSGYHLGYIEKNHLLDREEFSNVDYVDLEDDRPHDGARSAFWDFRKKRLSRLTEVGAFASAAFHDFPESVTDTGITKDSALRFLGSAPKEKPYCLTVSFSDPHVPHLALRRFESMYPLDSIILPDASDTLDGKHKRFRMKCEAEQALSATEEDKRRYLAVYYAMISYIDECIGEMLAAIDRRGDRENTMIVFTSDHGDFAVHHSLFKKDLVLLDDLLHVNCLISYPDVVRTGAVSGLCEQIDVMPTLLDLAGIEIPFGCQGISMKDMITGKTTHHKDAVYAEICRPYDKNMFSTYAEYRSELEHAKQDKHHPLHGRSAFNIPGDYSKMIRTDIYKYIWYHDGYEELYNVRSDPHETINLADSSQQRMRCSEMRMSLFEWCVRSEDPLEPRDMKANRIRYQSWKHFNEGRDDAAHE